MLSILVSRSALRTAGGALARPSAFSGLSRATALSFRTFLTSAPAQLAAKAATKTATTKATTKSKKKETTKAKPKASTARATKKPAAKGKSTASAKEPVKSKFDRKLLSPPRKHATTSYSAFLTNNWDKDPGTTFVDKMAAASKTWNGMSEAEKQPYVDIAKNNIETYEKEYTAWFVALPKGYLHEVNTRRKSKNQHPLRKPKSLRLPPAAGYMNLHRENFKAHPEMSVAEAAKQSGERWRALSQEERDAYNQRARQLRSDFIKAHPDASKIFEVNRAKK
ncbi:hypothetical protein BDP27DRAFT_1316802 [Rhodocollybia butyracea]|uniref:HMG box domain-containing protein n=1 Tax=Rhodocollybia butyracea TaxID=206335 RepID=A0A9P5UD35_9AGAR|nr:hypothetical protein BDP27DRAFT_1316802 [Rhodocollybia butyracea]